MIKDFVSDIKTLKTLVRKTLKKDTLLSEE